MVLSKRHLSVAVLLVIIASLALRFTPLTIGVPVSVNENTEEIQAGGLVGSGSTSFLNAAGEPGELLDGTQYITSWMADSGDSEKIVTEGRYRAIPLQAAFVRGCQYTTSLNIGLGWVPAANPNQEVACPAPGFDEFVNIPLATRTLHSPLIGGIRVELQLYISFDPTGIISPFTWQAVARDEAHLRTGTGDVAFDKPTYGIGQTAIIRFDVGYASSQKDGGTWTIQLFDPPDRGTLLPIMEWAIGPGPARSSVTHTWDAADFVSGTSNIFTVKLLNTIVGVKDDDTAVVDDINLAPTIVSISVAPPGTRKAGDVMTVTTTAIPNDLTGLPIVEYFFHIRSGPSNVIVDGWQVSNVFTFTIQSDGDIQINACVRDSERTSCGIRVNVIVEEPDNPFGGEDSDPFNAPWWMWLGIGALLFGALGVQFLPQIPPGGRNIVSIFAIAGSAVLFITYLALPVIEAYIREFIPGVF